MPILAYRAKQSTDTAGTGTLVLNAAASNARSFQAAFGNTSRRVQYVISWSAGFEIGFGDFDGASPGSLTRATVLASSNAGGLVTLPAGTKDVFTAFDPAAHEVVSIAGTTTLALADVGNTVVFTGSSAATLNFPAVATVPLGAGFMVLNQGTATLTLDPSDAETVNGSATMALRAGSGAFVRRVANAWVAQVVTGPDVIGNLSVTGQVLATAGTAAAPAYSFSGDSDTGIYSPSAGELAATINGSDAYRIRATGVRHQIYCPDGSTNYLISGTTRGFRVTTDAYSVNLEGVDQTGVASYQPMALKASEVVVSAGSSPLERMRIPGSGDIEIVGPVNVSSGALKVGGNAVGINRGTERATTSGVQIDFTSIPAGVREITALFNGVSTNGSSILLLQLGTSGGVVSSGYTAGTTAGSTNFSSSAGFAVAVGQNAASEIRGILRFENISGNSWVLGGTVWNGSFSSNAGGSVALSGVLDRLRLTTVGGSDTFDLGAFNLTWRF